MRAGSITDDTEQAVLLARRLITDDGDLDVHRYADDLIAWEAAMKAKGSLDLLGPSTKSALQALRDGESPEATGRFGTTNGGAMRAAPVGIAYPRTPELDAAALAEFCGRSPLPVTERARETPLLVTRLPLPAGEWRDGSGNRFRVERRGGLSQLFAGEETGSDLPAGVRPFRLNGWK